MQLASLGVGGVRRVRLALLYVGSCVGVLWMMLKAMLGCVRGEGKESMLHSLKLGESPSRVAMMGTGALESKGLSYIL